MPVCLPLQLWCRGLGAAAQVGDRGADAREHARDQLRMTRFAVVRGAHHGQLPLAEAEPLHDAGPHRGGRDERLGRAAQVDRGLDRADLEHDRAVRIAHAGGDVVDGLDPRSAPNGDGRDTR
jgi:hypothetical protein